MSTVSETMSVFPREQMLFENSTMRPDPSDVSLTGAMPRRLQIRTVLGRFAGKLRSPHHTPRASYLIQHTVTELWKSAVAFL